MTRLQASNYKEILEESTMNALKLFILALPQSRGRLPQILNVSKTGKCKCQHFLNHNPLIVLLLL
jgi:hypothetical protein